MKIIYQGFDGFDVSFQGSFPAEVRSKLAEAKKKAQEGQKDVLIYIGKKEIPVLVEPSGIKGYQFVFDTGLDREKWFVADNDKPDRWNILGIKKFN